MRLPDLLRVFSLATVVFWLSQVPYLPPIAKTPDIRGLAREGHEAEQRLGEAVLGRPRRSQEQLEQGIAFDLRRLLVAHAVVIAVGVVSGILIWHRKRIGQRLAVSLCAVLLLTQLATLLKGGFSLERLYAAYVLALSFHPVQTLHLTYLGTAFQIMSIVYLLNKRVSRRFSQHGRHGVP
jgi:hypothetical protein